MTNPKCEDEDEEEVMELTPTITTTEEEAVKEKETEEGKENETEKTLNLRTTNPRKLSSTMRKKKLLHHFLWRDLHKVHVYLLR